MEIEELIEEVVEIFETEPEGDYGSESTNQWVRDRGIRHRLYDAIDKYTSELPEEPGDESELESLRNQIVELEGDRDSLLAELHAMRQEI